MVETCVGPSELHLKKELTALSRSRFLRDPETCSSWRSPLSSRSVAAAAYILNNGNENQKSIMLERQSSALLDADSNVGLPLKSGSRRKKVFLYNWGHHSSKSSDSGTKLNGENRTESAQASTADIRTSQKVYRKGGMNMEDPISVLRIRETSLESQVRQPARKMQKSAIPKKHIVSNCAVSRLLDVQSGSLSFLNSTEPSGDTEYCNSETLQNKMEELIQRSGHASQVTSPLLSVSGCGNWSNSSKILKNTRREESSYSCTPASASSYNRYEDRIPSTVGSWDGTTTSFDGEERDEMDLPGRQGCGIPCYSSKRRKGRGCGGWYSPSLSDTLRRKGSSILSGSQTRKNRRKSSGLQKRKVPSKSSQGLPLLINGFDGGRSSIDTTSDELSTNCGELDLEALSRLDGRRWSNCRSQEGMELALPPASHAMISEHRSLSQKYIPRFFEEIVGQNIVVQSLNNAILRGKIAPAYLFQGPRGTGKTSVVRIFAAALNCLSTEENKPCGFCGECTDFASGNGSNVIEVDATNKKKIDRVRYLLKSLPTATTFMPNKVVVIDECHMLSSKMWSAFIKFLEEPPSRIVFVFITIDPDNLPQAVVSRCQKYFFPKIKDADIVSRLKKLSSEEGLDVELEALNLIALNSDGSLRDAEIMLDQLSLLGKRITASLVNDLIGVVSDEKLLDLLEIAMSSDAAETVRRSRELLDSGIEPVALMSQLAGLIMDIIAGTHQLAISKSVDSVQEGRSLTEAELNRLQKALKIISDAEKQLRHSSERSTWFSAALLQLCSGHSVELIHSSGGSSSSKLSTRKFKTDTFSSMKEPSVNERSEALLKLHHSSSASFPRVLCEHSGAHANTSSSVSIRESTDYELPTSPSASHKDDANYRRTLNCFSPGKLDDIWKMCIEGCHSKTLRNLLYNHGKLVSISRTEGVLRASVAFGDADLKSRAERFLSSITNSMENVLRHDVKVRIGLLSDKVVNGNEARLDSSEQKQAENIGSLNEELNISSKKDMHKESLHLPGKSSDYYEDKLQGTVDRFESSQAPDESFQIATLPIFSSKENGIYGSKEKGQEVTVQRTNREVTNEQKLESAWLQAAEKGGPGSAVSLKPERNQILPQNGISQQTNVPNMPFAVSSKHWEDELNQEIKALKIQSHQKEKIGGRTDSHAISPSILHSNKWPANFDKENPDYDSGPGCNGLLCWKNRKSRRDKGSLVRSQKTSQISLFGRRRSKVMKSEFRL